MLTIYLRVLRQEGAVIALVGRAGVCEPGSVLLVGGSEDLDAAVHCGTPMDLVTPATGPVATGYTFGPPVEAVQLPPVWRCGCGFQLDAWAGGPFTGDRLGHNPVPALRA